MVVKSECLLELIDDWIIELWMVVVLVGRLWRALVKEFLQFEVTEFWLVVVLVIVLSLHTMRILSWNCRCAGRAPTASALKALVREEWPNVVFILESKASLQK